MKTRLLLIPIAFTRLLTPSVSFGKIIQILHTNDLHAAMNTSGAPDTNTEEHGGWAQVKAKLDALRADAKAKGMETLQIDAGDFTEGTLNYFPDEGVHVLQAFQAMGYDAAAVGNHDWLMGAAGMNDLYGKTPFSFPVLSANIEINKRLKNLRSQIVPTTQIVKDGVRIGIVGLSTNEALYSWIPRIQSKRNDFKILDYTDSQVTDEDGNWKTEPGIANKYIHQLKQNNDLVIALTHIGYDADQLLAEDSDELDLVVGGHSHTFLESATFVQNRAGKTVPIVQTGFNGHAIGRILIEVDPNKTPKVNLLTYELVNVDHNGPADPVVAAKVQAANDATQNQFGPSLNDILGKSDDRLISGDEGPTSYAQFAVDSLREATGTEVGIDVGAFHGNTPQPAGDVTRKGLMMMYPRKFEFAQNEGLYVYQARVPGFVLKMGLQYSLKFGSYIATSGLTYDVKTLSDADYAKLKKKYAGTSSQDAVTPYYAENLKVNGEKLHDLQIYTVSAPESLVRGAIGITPLAKLILAHSERTSHTIWEAMESHLAKIKVIPKTAPSVIPIRSDVPKFNDKGSVSEMVKEAISEIVKDLPQF